MKPEISIEQVYTDKITLDDFPVYLQGYDPKSDQEFEGKFNYTNGVIVPSVYWTSNGEKLSTSFAKYAGSFMRRAKEEYYQSNSR